MWIRGRDMGSDSESMRLHAGFKSDGTYGCCVEQELWIKRRHGRMALHEKWICSNDIRQEEMIWDSSPVTVDLPKFDKEYWFGIFLWDKCWCYK